MRSLLRPAFLFIAIGLAIYGGVYYAAERLALRTGHSNAFFKIANAPGGTIDWAILGASHAMPLDFSDFNSRMEEETRMRILNLAAPGAGPLYNRFVLEHFLSRRHTRNLIYVLDSFAFYSSTWNEERFADAKLLRRTPLESAIALRLWDYVRREGVDARAILDYLSGFSKINNRERFQRDLWEGEAQFDRAYPPSKTAVAKRVAYLYPDKTPPEALARYLEAFSSLVATAQHEGIAVVVVKMPLPPEFRSQLPQEAEFDEAISRLLASRGVHLQDFSTTIAEPRFYFDTDHLNRAGLTDFFSRSFKSVLMSGKRD